MRRIAVSALVLIALFLPGEATAAPAATGSTAFTGTVVAECGDSCTGSFAGRWSGELAGTRGTATYALRWDADAAIELSSVTLACGPAGPALAAATGTGTVEAVLMPEVSGYWANGAVFPVLGARMTFSISFDGTSVQLTTARIELDVLNAARPITVFEGPLQGVGSFTADSTAGGTCPGSAAGSFTAAVPLG